MALPVTLPEVADQTKDIKNAGNIDQLCINTIRTLAMDAVQQANSGHPGTPMALAPVAYCFGSAFSATILKIPSGPTVTALSFPMATPPCCFIRCSTLPGSSP